MHTPTKHARKDCRRSKCRPTRAVRARAKEQGEGGNGKCCSDRQQTATGDTNPHWRRVRFVGRRRGGTFIVLFIPAISAVPQELRSRCRIFLVFHISVNVFFFFFLNFYW